MSSTEDPRLGRFFDKRLVPLAKRLRDRGTRFFPMGPDAEAESYYLPVSRVEPEFIELEGPEACEKALRSLWEEQRMPELAALAGPLLDLALRLEIREEEWGEISPFVYVMY
jgi:hypothetical protein